MLNLHSTATNHCFRCQKPGIRYHNPHDLLLQIRFAAAQDCEQPLERKKILASQETPAETKAWLHSWVTNSFSKKFPSIDCKSLLQRIESHDTHLFTFSESPRFKVVRDHLRLQQAQTDLLRELNLMSQDVIGLVLAYLDQVEFPYLLCIFRWIPTNLCDDKEWETQATSTVSSYFCYPNLDIWQYGWRQTHKRSLYCQDCCLTFPKWSDEFHTIIDIHEIPELFDQTVQGLQDSAILLELFLNEKQNPLINKM